MIEYVNLGKIVDVNRYSMTNDDALGCHVTVDFFVDDSVNFDRLQTDIAKLLAHPNNYILCDIEDVIQARNEIASLKGRIKRLECKLDDVKKESDKKLCEVYTETAETFYKSADKLISIDKMIAELKKERDYWKRSYDDLVEYWDNTCKDLVATGKKVGVKINIRGKKPDSNAGFIHVTNEKDLELEYKLNTARQIDDKKWQAMFDALKDKGIEVIYMGEEDEKPIIDVKIPKLDELKRKVDVRARHIDILKKKLETLKSRTLDNVEIRLSCGDIVWTYCDGFVHVSSGIINADEISTGTIPKCSSCAHYMHNPSRSRFTHDWCYMPITKEGGSGYIRMLSTEEAEGPACSDFKARKE